MTPRETHDAAVAAAAAVEDDMDTAAFVMVGIEAYNCFGRNGLELFKAYFINENVQIKIFS